MEWSKTFFSLKTVTKNYLDSSLKLMPNHLYVTQHVQQDSAWILNKVPTYTAKLHQSLCCTVTTWWLPQWWCSPCCLIPDAVTTGQWLHGTPDIGYPFPWGPCRNLAAMHLAGNITVTIWTATRYPIPHSHHVGIKVAQIHGFVSFH